ncbi:MAG: hypothetical protein DRI69_09900 [Bacteroidetes bacterium]|nr:MAG: hypothetical protein DRI69_09900 [Bacteroidota bacterium]
MIKKILFPALSVFLLYRSIDLVNVLMASAPSDFNVGDFMLISFLLCLFITGIFAITGFAYPTHKILTSKYYELKNPDQLIRTYRFLNVDIFKKGLMAVFWGTKKNRKKYFDGTRDGIENFIYQSKQSEFGHLGAFVLILISSFVLLAQGYFILVASMTFINIIGNLYPIILQRYHRLRIEKLSKYFA